MFALARAKGELTEQMKGIEELTKHFRPEAEVLKTWLKAFDANYQIAILLIFVKIRCGTNGKTKKPTARIIGSAKL